MFVKIKLENLEVPRIFAIEDRATICDLKEKLEVNLNIDAQHMELKTLQRTLLNEDVLYEIMNLKSEADKCNGLALSVYSYEEFTCFLQLYNKMESDNQTNFFNQPPDAKRLPIDRVPQPQYCESILDSDSSWHSTTTENDLSDTSSNSSSSSTRSESSKEASKLKRKHKEDYKTPEKRTCPANCPSSAKKTNFIEESPVESIYFTPLAGTSTPLPAESHMATVSAIYADTIRNTTQSINNESQLENPFVELNPLHRQYALAICNDIAGKDLEYSRIMDHFYSLFISNKNCGRLNFSESTSITVFEGKLWVMCEDRDTFEWIGKGAQALTPYKCCNFIDIYKCSFKCRLVLPLVVDNNELSNIFKLLELQNNGLSTEKWCAVERMELKPDSEQYVTNLCKTSYWYYI